MPPQTPASFASAAAASNGGGDGSSSRGVGGSGDWSRPRANGATTTFRRTSQATTLAQARESSHQPSTSSTSASNVYVPPHLSSTHSSRPAANDHKFSKEQLLDMFKGIPSPSDSNGTLSNVLTEGWAPGAPTSSGNGGWARRDDPKEVNGGPDICWDQSASVKPLGFIDMDDEERELFTTSVNSPLKPPPQNSKEGAQTGGTNGRKSSISQSQNPASILQSGRPGTRRRETSDTVPMSNPLASPTAFDRSSRGDQPISTPPATLLRRRTDYRESGSAEKTKLDTGLENMSSPFGSFKRTTTNPMSAGLNGPSSPWAAGPQSAGFGAFGNFSLGGPSDQPSTPGEKKTGFGSMRGESRFRGLMGKDSSEDIGSKAKEKQGLSLLERLGETDQDVQSPGWGQPSAVKDRYPLGDQRIGSAALGGEDASPPPHNLLGMDQRRAQEEIGFSSLNREPRLHETPQSVNRSTGQFDGAMSPTVTNPYQSPEANLGIEGVHDDEEDPSILYGSRADRSQTSSTNPNRGPTGLQGFGNLGLGGPGAGWSAAPGTIGSTSRVSSAFTPGYQDSIFGSMNDVSSPFGNAANTFGSAFGSIGRGTGKMSSLFPASAQEQMRHDHVYSGFGPPGAMGLGGGFGMPIRDTDSPSRSTRGPLDDLFPDTRSRGMPNVSSPFGGESLQRPDSASQASAQQMSGLGAASLGGSNATVQAHDSNQMPAAQKRQMVMPDRMRWIYRDPSGQTQGPWSGLEMHDWYKAGFFSPELLVRKQEDDDYEPLAQLIRRIGNSREPFLVPQIGIPHGPETTQPGGTSIGLAPVGPQGGSAQPPFPSSFPSFGTTLTAQQQNDLERRKQEEQFLMARQKEQLAAHQAMMKNMQMSGIPHGPQGLNHHSSAQSLHSQPSFGSITSPSAFQHASQQAPIQHAGNMPGFFDRSAAHAFGGFPGDSVPGRDNDLTSPFNNLNLGRSTQSPYGAVPVQNQDFGHQQQVASMLQDRIRLQREQEQMGELGQPDDHESQERLEQFNQLVSQEQQTSSPQGVIGRPFSQDRSDGQSAPSVDGFGPDAQQEPSVAQAAIPPTDEASQGQQTLALPGPSRSPLPAPQAQHNRQQVLESLTIDNRSRSQTPSVDTPSAPLAPWSKEPTEGSKGPSLKEIQEAEAKKAAQREAIAAEARRQAAEQERIAAANAQVQAVAGLPSGANWAASASPTTTASAASAWAKKAAVVTPTTGTKKTLAQIQKEEEARKNRAAAAAAASQNANIAAAAITPGGKRYADLASKVSSPAPVAGGAWTTVGASGKARAPVGPAAMAPQRTASGGVASVVKPKAPVPSRTNTAVAGAQAAQDEFQKWAKNALGKGLNSSINVDDFVRNLLQLPAEPEILSEAVYANSQILDGRRFAEEFVRRRKQADKGVAPEASAPLNFSSGSAGASDSKAAGGWSEVAKKGPGVGIGQEQGHGETQAFKVVAAKKKGKR